MTRLSPFRLGRVTNNEHYKYIDVMLCKLRNPWAGFFTAGWYELLNELHGW